MSNNIFSDKALMGKRILITGATSGIGKTAAIKLADCGAKLILISRSEDKLKSLISSISGSDHAYFTCDFAINDSLYTLIKSFSKDILPIDGAFHSAGIEFIRAARLTRSEDLSAVSEPSIGAAISLSRAIASKGIMSDGGSILFMSSVAGFRGTPGMIAYSATKGAIDSMSRALAAELSKRKIRSNTIVSGAVEGPMHNRIVQNLSEEALEDYKARHPLGFGKPIDIAQLVIFLLSDASAWITGSSVVIDGGYSVI